MRTKLLRSGKYQIVRIPQELGFEPTIGDVEIERLGNELIVRPIDATIGKPLFKAFSPALADELRAIGERCASLPVLDDRTADEILDYDERGIPRP